MSGIARRAGLLLAMTVVAPISVASAQSIWLPRVTQRAVWAEALHPMFDEADEQITTGAFFVGYRGPFDQKTSVVAELCLARFGATGEADAFIVGNPYIGLEYPVPGTPIFFEFGGRVSIVDTDEPTANLTGVVSDVNRWEGFLDATSFQLGINARHVAPSGLMVRGRIVPVAVVSSVFGNQDWDGFLLYALQAGFGQRTVRAGLALCSRTLLFEDGTFSERSIHQADVHLDFGSGKFRPGIDVTVPLDEFDDAVPVVVGVRLGVDLN